MINHMKLGSVSERCRLLNLSRSAYYAGPRQKEAKRQKDQEVVERLRRLAKDKKYKLGVKGLTMRYTRAYKEPINHKKVARIKREYDIPTTIRQRRYKTPEQPKPQDHMVIPENILNREFNVDSPFKVTGTDVTYLWLPKLSRFAYLANVRDMATGEYLGWSVSFFNDQTLADASVLHVLERHPSVPKECLLHSDRGGTYTSEHFQKDMLRGNGFTPSMSRKGNCIDNAPTESGHGHLKDWLELKDCKNLTDVREEVNRVIHYFNEERPQWHRKKMTPVEYRCHLLQK